MNLPAKFIIFMVKDSLINRLEGIQILEKFLHFQCDIDKLSEYFQPRQRSKQQLIDFLKEKIKEIILEIQCELFRSKKIEKLQLFDHVSERMFEELMKMNKYFPEKLFENFVFEEKIKYERVQKSKSSTKMEMYSYILKYAQEQDLFKYIFVENEEVIKNKGPYYSPTKIYGGHQLEIICIFYQFLQGKYQQIGERLAALGYSEQKFTGYLLERNLKNLQLIGLYKCYLKSAKARGGKGITWQKFIQDADQYEQLIEELDPHLKIILVKMAIRNEIKSYQIRIICRTLKRKYQDKPFLNIQQPPPLKNSQKHCETDQAKKLRQKLLAILNTKVWFNHMNNQS